ncbi:hypothetical protein XFF6166_940017 [Xanthomonas citri pv. fuscans]|uniref:Uncharacterized protein n=1 Tax=Xanthomonas campestris pv. phaseoli TaxID=317013 RepID=A0A7Z7J1B3_XANCH|nr:hypothetical protein XFF6166_940017 [Xanthomonas citri pv. fuscans]SOO25493.1 hypothetical protein XFF6991_460048 [Xanthomonas phaseoli pv. phaseoli]SON95244.1 hypothetical protein XFF6990_200248 [Xanthomonas citri pv. fuscans]SON98720.1 hypothetical protein XFF6960_1020017 [Xanthomonas citri pv. fuscans]SOO05126.1 hypothetical protein XFF7767_370021 [Xanthomonas citri pv. fuscans]
MPLLKLGSDDEALQSTLVPRIICSYESPIAPQASKAPSRVPAFASPKSRITDPRSTA